MSPDVRSLVQAAAPRPAAGVDVRAIERRARRRLVVRSVAAALVLVAVGASAGVVASLDRSGRDGVVGDPRPQPAPPGPEVDRADGRSRIPGGRRYEIASGSYGDDWHEPWAGERWRLLVWGRGRTSCWQMAEGDAGRREGVSCSLHDGADGAFLASMSLETGSRDPAEFTFVAGELAPTVDRLRFRGDRGPGFSIPVLAAPARSGVPYRYYTALLPRYDYARLVASSAGGEVLDTRRLCGIGCEADRQRAAAEEVRAYEDAPVTLESAAAAFANEAAGRAGLIDQLGTYWIYQTISQDDLVAIYETTDCSDAVPDDGYRCDRDYGAGSIDVGVVDDRFVVEGAEGPMTSEQREALESYSAPAAVGDPEWRHVASSFAETEDGRWEAAFVVVWTGNMDAPREYGSACRFTVYDSDGDTLYRSRKLPFEVRGREYYRVSGLTTEVGERRAPEDIAVACDEPGPDVMDRTFWGR
ncbi:MAG TPA: hypothetical protein VHN37_05040 [Actinomycetota bacterium]|nr:hypothetical protein [Actinomycetota bacterium]